MAAHALTLRQRVRLPLPWLSLAALLAAVVILPVIVLGATAAQGSEGLWSHVGRHVLPQASLNTLWLLLGVGIVVGVIGTGCAWLVSAYEFPGRRWLSWALLLPLAVPTYVVAYAYLDLLHPLGPVQSLVRDLLGYDSPRQFRLPDIRSLAGCIGLLGLVLYPYVYATVRAMFATQAASVLESARSLGAGPVAVFTRVALPLARPAIAVGMSLALLETLNDIGASQFLGIQTLTVSVYTTWVTRSDLAGAAQIALSMLVLVVLLVVLERYSRRRQRYASSARSRPLPPARLRGGKAWLATALVSLPVLLGFVAPFAFLAWESWKRMGAHGIPAAVLDATWNTFTIAVIATGVTVAAGLLLAWSLRLAQYRGTGERFAAVTLRVGSLGYALPGTVLAIGLLTPMAWFDAGVARVAGAIGLDSGMVLMASGGALVLAYTLRFLAITAGGIDAGFGRVPVSMDHAAGSLGHTPGAILRRVHWPLLRPALAGGALLVFVDTMKELPATLLLRPMNFETLATWLYADAARGAYEDGAMAALLIVLVGLLPVILLARTRRGAVVEVPA